MIRSRTSLAALALAAAVVLAGTTRAAGPRDSLQKGTPELQSISALAFGPEGVLFIGDARAAAVVAVDTGDRTAAGADRPKVEALDEKIASLLGTEPGQLLVNDLAVNPMSGNTYVGVTRGKGADAKPVLLRVERSGKIAEVPMTDVMFASMKLPNPGKGRGPNDVITDMAYLNGKLYVACLSNEEFSSQFRVLPFPFGKVEKGTAVEIFHGSHGQRETRSPIRTFAPFEIKGETNLLAAYTCTPLVQVPVTDLKPGEKVKGKTVAELGNRNVPLDMIVYQKGGKDYILMANSARGVMKISTEGIDSVEPIEKRIADKAGLKYETIKDLEGTVQLDAFDKDHVLVLRKKDNRLNLETVELP
jgi:hypothetical protein